MNSSFLSVQSNFLICSSRASFLPCRSRNFCLMIAKFLSNSVVVEKIAFSLKAWLYGMLLFSYLGCSDLACKNACWSVGLQYKICACCYFRLYITLRQKMQFFLVKFEIQIWYFCVFHLILIWMSLTLFSCLSIS